MRQTAAEDVCFGTEETEKLLGSFEFESKMFHHHIPGRQCKLRSLLSASACESGLRFLQNLLLYRLEADKPEHPDSPGQRHS